MPDRQVILVTGSHRSGSTWVGNVIASNREVDNIIEPFNLNRIKRFNMVDWPYWFPRVDPESPESLKAPLRHLIHYYTTISYTRVFKEMWRSYEGHPLIPSFKKRLRRASKPVKLLKDPMALFSIPWMVEEFGVKPVILLRHPAAFALSIKDKEWWFEFENMLDQPGFFSGALEPLEREVLEYQKKQSPSIIENAALFWKIGYARVLEYQEQFPNWYYVKHEDLSLHPFKEYEKLFRYLNLPFDENIQSELLSTTRGESIDSDFQRDSVKNATKWKQKLTPDEITMVFSITRDVASQLYLPWI